jgi:hypothetical protein
MLVQDQRTLTNMAEGSEAIIRQNGNFNKAEQMQKERTTMRKRLKMVIITAWTTQTGDMNSAITSQDGNYNRAWATQTGDSNEAITRQKSMRIGQK